MKSEMKHSAKLYLPTFCVLAVAFVAWFVPETKGITLEEMEFNLKNGVRLRELGNHVPGH